jgi:hypothetical protein
VATLKKLTVRQWLMENLFARRGDDSAVMLALTNVQTEVDINIALVVHKPRERQPTAARPSPQLQDHDHQCSTGHGAGAEINWERKGRSADAELS